MSEYISSTDIEVELINEELDSSIEVKTHILIKSNLYIWGIHRSVYVFFSKIFICT